MKLIKGELKDKIWDDVYGKVFEHAPWNSPVSQQIRKNLGWWDDDLFRLKIDNPRWNIRDDLNETD